MKTRPWQNALTVLAYPLLRLAIFGMRLVPIRLGYRIAAAAAWCAYHIDLKRRRRGILNVGRAMPETSPARRMEIVRGVYRNVFCVAYEFAINGKMMRAEGVQERITRKGFEHYESLPRGDIGAIGATAHFGSWEVLGPALSFVGWRLHSVARGADAGILDRYWRSLREVNGQRIVSFQGAIKEGRRIVQQGGNLAFVADQHAPINRIWVPFCGRLCGMIKTPAGMARRFNVPLCMSFCRRIGLDYRFEIQFFPLVRPNPDLPAREDIARMTLIYAKALEAHVRKYPEDYLWLFRIWRKPIDGEEYIGGDGTYVRHATFGPDGLEATADSRAVQPGASGAAGEGDGA